MKKGKLISKIFAIALVFAMLTSTLGGLVWAREGDVVGAGYVDVSVEQAKEMIDSDPDSDIRVLDVRTENEYGAGHIGGAELVPLSELEQRTGELDKDDALLVYCKSGTRSAEASNILIQHEFESVYNMEGGINAWVNAGYPIVSSPIGNQSGQGCSSADSQTSTTMASSSLLSSDINGILDSNKSVFLFFYADWCHFCQEQKPIIDELEQEYTGEISFICVNAEDNPQAMEEFGVTGFPAMFLIAEKDEGGEYVYQEFAGFTDKETLKESFDYLIENGGLPEDASDSSIRFEQAEFDDSSIVNQEQFSIAEFEEELANDSELKELHDYVRELGYFYPSDIERITYSDGTTTTIAVMCSSDNSSIFLSRYSSDTERYSMLMRIDDEAVTFFSREGGIQIGTNGSMSSWGTHHSCNHWLCTSSCYVLEVDIIYDVAKALKGVLECVACVGKCVPLCVGVVYEPGLLEACFTCLSSDPLCYDCAKDSIEVLQGAYELFRICKDKCHDDPSAYPYPGRNCCLNPSTGVSCPNTEPARLKCGDYHVIVEPGTTVHFPNAVFQQTCTDCEWLSSPNPIQVCGIHEVCVDIPTPHCKEVDSPDVPPDGDNPDETYDVSTPEITSSNGFDAEITSDIAVLFKGFPISTADLVASFNEPSTFVDIGFSSDLVNDYSTLIIPSGGLYGLDSLPSFKSNLEQYVEKGGTLIVFSQQHGYEFNALPGGEVSGYGWLEDQSCHHGSVGISSYHPILSGQDSVISDLAVDGFFTSYPDDATVLLSRTKNGMPAMLMYEYGEGTVIATTAYTDWAYGKGQATQDGINLVRDMIAWAKDPVQIPEYGASDTVDIPVDVFNVHLPIPEVEYPQYTPGDAVSIPIEITNYSDNQTSERVVFSVFDPDYEMVDMDVPAVIPPGETTAVDFTYETTGASKTGIYFVLYSLYAGETVLGGGFGSGFGLGVDTSELSTYKVNFALRDPDKNIVQEQTATLTVPAGGNETTSLTYANPSKLGIWSLEYEILDYNDMLLESGVQRFAVSKYAENPDGFVYHGEEISYAVSSGSENYAYGSDGTFTIKIWNHGDIDRTVTCWWSFPHNYWARHDLVYGSPGTTSPGHKSNLYQTLIVPAHGSTSFIYSVPVYSYDRLWAEFYEGDETSHTYLGRASRGFYVFNPLIEVNVSTDKQEYIKGEGVSLQLNLENKRSATYDANAIVRVLDAENNKVFEESFNVTLLGEASHEETLGFSLSTTYGVYVVSAEAYVEGEKVGSGSTYFEVCKDYMVRVAFDHPGKIYRARESMGIDLEAINAGATPWSSIVDISIPVLGFTDSVDFALDPGQSEKVSYNLSIPGGIAVGKHQVILTVEFDGSTEEYYFFIPQSELVLSIDKTGYDAGENLSINLSNTGGVDTTGDCSIRFYDSYGFMIYEGESQESVQAGESRALEFIIPEQTASGKYYLLVWCKDLTADKVTRLSKSCTVEGLEASVTSVTDKKTYFTDEDIFISTNITNLDGEIVDGALNLKIFSRIGLPGSMLADSAGEEFFLVYTDNYDAASGSAVFITSDVDTSGVVEIPGIGFSQPFTVTTDTITTVNIPLSAKVSGSDNIEDRGIHVTAEDDITVYFLNPSTPRSTNDAYLALPADILGTEYVVLAYQETLSARGYSHTLGPSEIAIVAPYDDTVVTITPSATVEARIAGAPYNIVLQGYQTYTLQSDSPLEDLTGTVIESSRPVAVFAGVRCADIPAGYAACDHLVEQMMPIPTWGKEFDTFPFMPRLNELGDFLRILASVDDTIVTANGSVLGTIDRGEFLEITVTEPLEISATKPVLVAQYLTGEDYEGRTGDPFECLIPPTEQFLSEYTFVTPTGYAENYVNIVAPTSSLDDLLLDGSLIDADAFSPFGTRGLSAGTIALGEGSHTMLGSEPFGIYVYGYEQYGSYGYPGGLSLKALKKHLIWEENIPIDISAMELKNIVRNVSIPNEMPDITGKLDLVATLFTSASQIIGQSEGYSFFITGEDTSFTMETAKEVYKPNEAITIYGEVQNNAEVANNYSLSIKKGGEEIFSDFLSLAPSESHSFTTGTSSESSFTLEGTVDGIAVVDFITIEFPNVDVTILAPDVVGLADFDVGILVENIASVDCDISVTLVDEAWDVLIPAGESRLMETTMSITEDTTLSVIISGDVEKTVQKDIIMGEDARIEIVPQNIYLEGMVEIPFTVENTGLLDTEFEATFSISSPEEQTIVRTFFIPQGESIADTLSFDLTQGEHLLTYLSPLEEGTVEVHVGVPEFVVTELPSNLNLIWGQEVTWTFKVGNIGGAEGEACLYLMLPDFEETKFTWVMPGHEEEIIFDFTVPDDLEEKEYKAIYELDGVQGEFSFFVQGAKVSVNATLDKALYEEGETAILTLTVTNECAFNLSLYARTQLHGYEEIQPFELTDSETLQFNIPVTFNGNKLFYGIYMESGRALYLNSMYVHKKGDIISLYTDKQVYFTGETVTVFVNTTQSGILNITAPGYAEELTIDGSTVLTFTLPELRSGTYYIDYTFDGFPSSYPFDVVGYSARIIEFGLDKESYLPGELILMEANVEVGRDVTGLLRVQIYGPEHDALDEFDIPVTLVQGENMIEAERIFLSDRSGIHSLVYQLFGDLAGHSLVLLSSGAEYFDGISGNTPPVADAGPDQTVCVIPPATTAMVTLDGSGSYDADGDPLTYTWSWDTDTAYGVNPTVELPLGTTTITLVVNDGKVDSEPDTVNITVNPKPAATASSNSPVSEGSTIELYGGPDGMTSYSWTGPGFSSSLQNPILPNATKAMEGTYFLVVTNEHGCTSDPATINVVVRVPTVPSPGDGPSTRYLSVDWDGKITDERLLGNDWLAVDLLGPSPDGSHSLLLEQGTHAPTVDGETYYLIVIREVEEIPPSPENAMAIMAFNVTPAGAVFDRDVFLTLGLDQSQLPEDALNVTMAYYDDVGGGWVPLESEAGGPSGVAELTISAAVNHFSIFGVLVEVAPTPPPSPAHFVPSGLSIVPSVEKIWKPVTFVTKTGESVTITANVANDGGQEGTSTVELKLNGETVDTEIVTLGEGQSQPVSFTVSGLDYGQYQVEVAGLTDEFTTSRTITWWLIIVIIVAIGLIIWGVVRGRRRRRRASQEG